MTSQETATLRRTDDGEMVDVLRYTNRVSEMIALVKWLTDRGAGDSYLTRIDGHPGLVVSTPDQTVFVRDGDWITYHPDDGEFDVATPERLAMDYVPGPAKLTKWSKELVGTWVDYRAYESPLMLLDEGTDTRDVLALDPRWGVETIRLEHCTPRPDLARVDLTPRPIDPEATPRTVTTVEEYAAMPEGSIVAKLGGRALTMWGERWRDTLGLGPHTDDRMAGTTRTVLREGWGE